MSATRDILPHQRIPTPAYVQRLRLGARDGDPANARREQAQAVSADRGARRHRRPAHGRARRRRTGRSTGTAARASTRRASSRRSSTPIAAATTASLPLTPARRTKQLYFPDTNVLITRSLDPDGVCEVQDFMPIESTSGERHRHRLIRRVLCVRGTVDMRLECEPSFDYGRAQHTLELGDRGALFKSAGPVAVALDPCPARAGRHGRARPVHPERGRERRVRARTGRPRVPRSVASCGPARRPPSSRRPSSSGAAGSRSRSTGAAGARWSRARR